MHRHGKVICYNIMKPVEAGRMGCDAGERSMGEIVMKLVAQVRKAWQRVISIHVGMGTYFQVSSSLL